jgi:hypothetical protein
MKEKSMMGEEEESPQMEAELRRYLNAQQMEEFLPIIAQLIFCEESMA